MIGIYRIKNISNGKCYYGSSKDIEKRILRHKRELNSNTHINCILQRAWNKYGQENFLFEVVEECDVEFILEKEQKYLDLQPDYNIGVNAGGGDNLTKNPNRRNIIKRIKKTIKQRYDSMSDDEKKELFSRPMESNPNWKGGSSLKYCECGIKIAPINETCSDCRNRSGENNPFYGKKHSTETRKKLSESRMGKKPTNMKQVIINGVIYESLTEASRQTTIPTATILWRIKSKNKKFISYDYYPTTK